ncbi:hypothetical protein F5Y05DRAFT_416327 [Hypoxylon sp. FL0543]|nr:hypothetical protein F5Y05DRAFT_416327 [Hypoxylon sp. FL0543]
MVFPDPASFAEAAKNAAKNGAKWAAENPGRAVMYGIAGTAIAVPAAIAGPLLGTAGFTANGIAAGSLAAGAQAGIGNVAAGSLFATLQSAGMAGYGAAIVNGVVQAGGVAYAVGSAVAAKFRKNFDMTLVEKPWAWLRDDVWLRSAGEESLGNGVNFILFEDAVEQSWARMPEDMINRLLYSVLQQIDAFTKSKGATEY